MVSVMKLVPSATVLTAELPDPYGYGRIVRDEEGVIERFTLATSKHKLGL